MKTNSQSGKSSSFAAEAQQLKRAEELLNRKEAAEYLTCKPQTLAVWASTHRYHLPFVRVGRLVRYRRTDLDRFLESRVVDRLPEPEPTLAPKICGGK